MYMRDMRPKLFFFTFFIGSAFFVDLVLGTSRYPKLLIMACAIVLIYEFVSPYVYTPS
jgi:hypothetical protein